MLRNLVLFVFAINLLVRCANNVKDVKAAAPHSPTKSIVVRQPALVPLTDSARLVLHLDSLPKAVFPRNVSDWNRGTPNINLADFKQKKLFHLLYKRIPRAIGGAGIDMNDGIDTTFNLCDANYKANWFLIAKTAKFFVVEVDDNYLLLVTIDYHFNVIDAVHIAAGDPTSNNHFQGGLTSTIHKNLKIVMHYSYTQQAGEEDNYRTLNEINEDDMWRIDKVGQIKPIHYIKPDDYDPKY